MNFKNNMKKGFTLIELLVVIIIMISILILAIISVNNISEKNKEKAWEKVKNEVELAAKDYYEINNYKLGAISDSTTYARVSVRKLVEEDYLNAVTNPVNGKKVNPCSYVEVTARKNEFSYKYKESLSDKDCDIEELIEIKEIGGPSIDVKMSKTSTGNDGYYIEPVDVKAIVNTNNNGAIKEVKYSFVDEKSVVVESGKLDPNADNKYSVPAIDGKSVTIEFIATNIFNKSVTGTIEYKKDTEKPVCGTNNGSTTWTKNNRTIIQNCSDNTSGCVKDKYEQLFTSTIKNSSIKIEDKAGNNSTCMVDVYLDKTPPICGTNNGSTTWTNQDRTITQNCSDNDSGCKAVTKTYESSLKTDKITISDNVGNTKSCNVNVYVDKEKPKCSIAFSGTEGWNGWYITNDVNISMTKEDTKNKNGVKSGIGEFGLTTKDTVTYNDSATDVQKTRTNGTTWYGYVKDNAGNVNDCSKTVKLEKNVTISFDKESTNKSTSVNPDNKSDGKEVFNSSFSTCGYGTCSNINCYTDSDKKNQCQTEYFARSCMYVKTYARYFKVSSASTGNNKKVQVVDLVDADYKNGKTPGMKRIKEVNRYSCQDDWDSKYYFNNCGNDDGTGRNDFSAHVYQYITESGLGSNKIRLYTEYGVNCGY